MSAQRFPVDGDAVSAASYWFSRKRAGDMDVNELRALNVWLRTDKAHQDALDDLQRIWAMASAVEDDPEIMDVCGHEIAALNRSDNRRTLGLIAAGALLTTSGGWMLAQSGLLPDVAWFKQPAPQEYRTAVGQRSTFTLADGSTVTLDTDTVLRASFAGPTRHIDLERGRAFFQVAKDSRHPFIVAAGGKTVRATGTAFDVRVEPGQFQVTLIEGSVFVQERGADRGDGPVADMRPGWRLAIGNDMRWRMEPVDMSKATSWRDGTLVFFYDPLAAAAAEMNRYSDRKIVFKGDPPETFILGNFRAGDIDSFIAAVRMNKLARVTSETDAQVELAAR